MKKILSVILALAMTLSLAACAAEPAPETTATPETTAPTETKSIPVAEEVKDVTVPAFAIMINGVKVDDAMMASYPTYSVTAFSINSTGTESTTTYVGYAITDVFAAAVEFARVEGILPAPESSHAIKVAIDEALKCKETGEEKTILFGLTGTGYFDMMAYEKFHDGKMVDYVPTEEELQKGFSYLPKMD